MTEGTNQSSIVMDADEIDRTLVRMAHQILETNKGAKDLALVGIVTRGDLLAKRLGDIIRQIEGVRVPVGSLDISFYRDDAPRNLYPQVRGTDILFRLEGRTVVLVDDVLYTGRTIRAALDALTDFGRADRVQLAVLIDRGHRELPIRADFVGKNVPSSSDESVRLHLKGVDGEDCVVINKVSKGKHIGSDPFAK
jgi:pyrimidine operon attenuation protein/uracil phosphoribosyltransferase